MANSEEIIRYKQQLISTIINDYELIKLINSDYVNDNDKTTVDAIDLRYKNIFPFFYNPDPPENADSYIFITVDTPSVQNDLIKDMRITITVVSHQDIMRVPYDGRGTRLDQMSSCVDRLFNGRSDIGFGTLSLFSNYEGNIDKEHRCRILKFNVEEFNQSRCNA